MSGLKRQTITIGSHSAQMFLATGQEELATVLREVNEDDYLIHYTLREQDSGLRIIKEDKNRTIVYAADRLHRASTILDPVRAVFPGVIPHDIDAETQKKSWLRGAPTPVPKEQMTVEAMVQRLLNPPSIPALQRLSLFGHQDKGGVARPMELPSQITPKPPVK